MTATSKPSLLGRKRTKDLQPSSSSEVKDSATQVKRKLLDLQEDFGSEKPQLVKKEEVISGKADPKLGVKKVTKAEPTEKISRVAFEQEAFEYLLAFYQNLKNPHQAVRVLYSVSEQNRRLLEAIKKIINHYADSLKHANLNQKEIAQKSQHLLDTLVSRLIRAGVKLRSLSLTPDHKSSSKKS
jgi:hypothetical protein